MNRLVRMAFAVSVSLLLVTAGCNRGEDLDTDVDDIDVPDSIDLSGDTSVAFDSTDPVIDVDPEEYRKYLAQATEVDAEPNLLETKQVAVAYEKTNRPKREFTVRLFKNRPPEFIGEFKEWYENGQLWKQGEYGNGKREGPWKYWSPKGIIIKTGKYAGGQPDGEWTYFRQDGTRQRVESYAAGAKDGKWIEYDKSGRVPLMQVAFKGSQRHGAAIRWFPRDEKAPVASPQKQREIEYVDGRQHGKATEWYDNGQMKTMIEFRNGKRHGRAAQWNREGKLVTQFQFQDGERID